MSLWRDEFLLDSYLNYSRMRPVVIEQFSDKLFIITTNVIRFVTRLSVVVPKLWSHEAFKKRYTETKLKKAKETSK